MTQIGTSLSTLTYYLKGGFSVFLDIGIWF